MKKNYRKIVPEHTLLTSDPAGRRGREPSEGVSEERRVDDEVDAGQLRGRRGEDVGRSS